MADIEAFFGGTFDPIHYGHLRSAEALAMLAGLNKITLMPNNVPPHRPQPAASPAQRLEMLRLAVAGDPLFAIDDRELHRDEPSRTVDTLRTLRQERGPQQPLTFIIGQDSLLSLNKWYQWHELSALCHLLVCRRPGYAPQPDARELQDWLQAHQTEDIARLHQQPAGLVFMAETPLWPVSATDIRQRLRAGLGCDDLLPPDVLRYIAKTGLYRD